MKVQDYVTTKCSIKNCIKEDVVVGELRKESKPFASFYNAERRNIPPHIHWIEDRSLRVREARSDVLSNTTYFWQIPTHNAFIVAHELCTYLLKARGFPTIGARRHNNVAMGVSAALNNMLGTPLRDSMLAKYGFNLKSQYEKYLDGFFKSLVLPETELGELWQACFIVQMQLYWENVLGKSGISDFYSKFEKRFPNRTVKKDIISTSNDLSGLVRKHGYNTPKKMGALYLDILGSLSINGVKLGQIVVVGYSKYAP